MIKFAASNLCFCSFCDKELTPDEISPNDFYPSCFDHKQLAQIKFQEFVSRNRDYKIWNKSITIQNTTPPDAG